MNTLIRKDMIGKCKATNDSYFVNLVGIRWGTLFHVYSQPKILNFSKCFSSEIFSSLIRLSWNCWQAKVSCCIALPRHLFPNSVYAECLSRWFFTLVCRKSNFNMPWHIISDPSDWDLVFPMKNMQFSICSKTLPPSWIFNLTRWVI